MIPVPGTASEETLTRRQRDILDFIRKTVRQRGFSPSIREICMGVGLSSSSTVHSHLIALEKRGFIRRDPSCPRTIGLVDSASYRKERHPFPPFLGEEFAGSPHPLDFLEGESSFLLRMEGDSMKEVGILHGDYVLARRQESAADGDLVVALFEGEPLVRRFLIFGNHVRLEPENHRMKPLVLKDAHILGKVTGVIRKL